MNKNKNVLEEAKNPKPIDNIKKGDYLFCQSPTSTWICLVSHIEDGKIYYHANYNLKAKILNSNDWFLADYLKRFATLEEKKLLLSKIHKGIPCQ